MMKKYRAIYMSDEEEKKNYTKDGFSSVEEAEKYTFTLHCGTCKRYHSKNPKEASCFVEWDIEEYEE